VVWEFLVYEIPEVFAVFSFYAMCCFVIDYVANQVFWEESEDLIYINLEKALFQNADDEFHVRVAQTLDEACKLLEVGFEYVTEIDGARLFRKRK
jgi:hypothetical protein